MIKLLNKRGVPVVLTLGLVLSFLSMTGIAHADEFTPAIKAYFAKNVDQLLKDPVVIKAIRAQNKSNAGISDSQIKAQDDQWRNEAKSGGGELTQKVLGNGLSKFLADKKSASNGTITEMFVMDAKGLNVGQSDITSDFMQGDEDKWQKTFGSGQDVLFIDAVEFDESTKSFQSQASKTIIDPDTGKPIGAITVGLNVEKLL